MDRMSVTLSMTLRQARQLLADRESRRPSIEIGLCGPRMPSGASGFMSNMSMWLGPAELVEEDHRLGPRAVGPLFERLSLEQFRQCQS